MAAGGRTPMTRRGAAGNLKTARRRPILGIMSRDDADWGGRDRETERVPPRALRPDRRDELRRRVDDGYYLAPAVTWEVARRMVASGDV